MKFILPLLFITFFLNSSSAQKLNKKFIKGTWKLNAIMLDSNYIVKINDPEYSIQSLMKEMRKAKPGSSIEDSLIVMSKWKETKHEMGLIFFIFNRDGTCVLSGKKRNGKAIGEQQHAHYEFDLETNEILIQEGDERFSSFKVDLKKQLIYMEGNMGEGVNMIMEFLKD